MRGWGYPGPEFWGDYNKNQEGKGSVNKQTCQLSCLKANSHKLPRVFNMMTFVYFFTIEEDKETIISCYKAEVKNWYRG